MWKVMSICYNPFTLEGKTIFITGASSGIGQATAIECSKLGANLIVTGRNKTRLTETMSQLQPGNHVMIVADLCNADDIKELTSQLPMIDGLVLCAGINETIPVQFCSPRKFQKIFETNFFSSVELVRLTIKSKKIKSGGSIVAISSAGGNFAINFGNGIYGSSKSALSTWCKFLAQELALKKIRVNTICPGMVKTPLIESGAISSEQLTKDMCRYPLKRFGEPSEIAWSCIYLLSDASAWVTGTDLLIDGGYNLR